MKLTEKTKAILRLSGVKRFNDFCSCPDNWHVDKPSSRIKPSSVDVLNLFVEKFGKFSTEPSIFFLKNGNLELAWEDCKNKIVEVELVSLLFWDITERAWKVRKSKRDILILAK